MHCVDEADCTALDLHLVDAWGDGWIGASLSIVDCDNIYARNVRPVDDRPVVLKSWMYVFQKAMATRSLVVVVASGTARSLGLCSMLMGLFLCLVEGGAGTVTTCGA